MVRRGTNRSLGQYETRPPGKFGAVAPAPQGRSSRMDNSSTIVEFDGERYLQIHGAWYNARTYIKPPEIISRHLDERYGTPRPPEVKLGRPPLKRTRM
mgnify:FL=1